ncbi:hypothetical protein Scep_000093 [Stephania cephalantha]|uniref:Protein kinase domain-containing protein n=1 Tax=Stephania cephalantha TaxID=152367 RepID=A0AAP0Q235_9MAGN
MCCCCCCSSGGSDPIFEDKQALIDFVNNFSHTRPLNWSDGLNVCDGWEESVAATMDRGLQRLDWAELDSVIPDLYLPNLHQLNLANNSLTGIVPKSLQRFPASTTFYGNNVTALSDVHSPSPAPSPRRWSKRGRKLGGHALMGIIIGACVAAILGMLLLLLLVMLWCWKRNGKTVLSRKLMRKAGNSLPEKGVSRGQDGTRLVFLDGCCYSFDLEDLLRASAEVLGKGTFGTTYKAVLEDVTSVVVKRLKEVSVGRREFEQQMELVGRIRHENVVELRAFYYSKDEKLMIYDYYTQGSVSALLHGMQVENRITLDWDTRLKIAIGAARGIACIHTQNGGKLVHGNIKASNIFLNPANYGCVSDLGLTTTLMNPPGVRQISRVAGYRAPEVVDARKTSQQSDVYSLGVLLLELLTGKSPVNATGSDEVVNLVRWVQSVVREEWTAEVFDVELMRYPNIEEEMVEMLQIALACVVRMPEQRPKMSDVVKMLEEIRRLEPGNHPHSTSKSGGSTPSPLAIKAQSSSSPK